MPPALDHPSLNLIVFDETFVVYKLSSREELPVDILDALTQRVEDKDFISVTRTSEEISIVCNATLLPNLDTDVPRWKCIKIKGPMDFGLTGILCDFSVPLKRAGIPIFTISTWNTDYVLVPEAKAGDATNVLKNDGWKFEMKDNL